jgi:hypothetical protein
VRAVGVRFVIVLLPASARCDDDVVRPLELRGALGLVQLAVSVPDEAVHRVVPPGGHGRIVLGPHGVGRLIPVVCRLQPHGNRQVVHESAHEGSRLLGGLDALMLRFHAFLKEQRPDCKPYEAAAEQYGDGHHELLASRQIGSKVSQKRTPDDDIEARGNSCAGAGMAEPPLRPASLTSRWSPCVRSSLLCRRHVSPSPAHVSVATNPGMSTMTPPDAAVGHSLTNKAPLIQRSLTSPGPEGTTGTS